MPAATAPQHQVHRAGRDRALRHAVIGGFGRVLRDDHAALLLHGFQAFAAVRPGSRQHHACGARSAVLGQRAEKNVERQTRAGLGPGKAQGAAGDRQVEPWRDNVDVILADGRPILRLHDCHRGVAGEQAGHHAFMRWIEVLDDDECHAAVGVQRAQKRPACRKAARRSAYSNNGKPATFAVPARRRPGLARAG